MNATKMHEASVKRYSDGKKLGTVTLPPNEWESYAIGEHPAYQWPEGIARAGDVLSDDQIEKMGITAATTIFLD